MQETRGVFKIGAIFKNFWYINAFRANVSKFSRYLLTDYPFWYILRIVMPPKSVSSGNLQAIILGPT